MQNLLKNINCPADVKTLDKQLLPELCTEIRTVLLDTISETGGHLASNLGAVELTVAMHRVFDAPQDSIVFDVGHQCYAHKLLTGRCEQFKTLRQKGGLSGFPKPEESPYDLFVVGHSSTSLSSAVGLARAKQLRGDDSKTIAVIGDGAFANGMIYEAINNIDESLKNLIVVLNDNKMSIGKSVGAVSSLLFKMRTNRSYSETKRFANSVLRRIPLIGAPIANFIHRMFSGMRRAIYGGTFFEELGFRYVGPVDGHDLDELCRLFENIKSFDGPLLIHAVTTKGAGYYKAEVNPGNYHGVGSFDVEYGSPEITATESFSNVFGKTLKQLGDADERIIAVTAAMKYATGLNYFYKAHKDRFFDVGIAEGHAVTFSAGLAKGGFKPVFAVYSTFLQRAYDQLFQDVSLEGLDVMLAVDRAGLVGDDGETHQGILDMGFLSALGFFVVSPANYSELVYWAQKMIEMDTPRAIRYPRGAEDKRLADWIATGKTFDIIKGNAAQKTLVVTYGRLFAEALEAQKQVDFDILKLNVISPLGADCIDVAKAYDRVLFVEEGVAAGGVGEQMLQALNAAGFTGRFELAAIGGHIVKQSSVAQAITDLGLDAKSIVKRLAGGR